MGGKWNGKLEKISDYKWCLPKEGNMRVPGMIYADEKLLTHIRNEQSLEQVRNVAHLPGIIRCSMAMPDIHWGYGFPIGGVAATGIEKGVISPGGVGYDINCGVRLLRTDLKYEEIKDKVQVLVQALFNAVPSGVGSKGGIRLNHAEAQNVMVNGAKWAVDKGYGWKEDLEFCEENGRMTGADPDKVSDRAVQRGLQQLGTLGAGNHFLEIQEVEEIYDIKAAEVIGIEKGQITVMIHTGSRGFGYQVCDDSLKVMQDAVRKYDISIPDRQLACAPINSPEGAAYYEVMCAAANYAWANRQCITHWIREAFEKIMHRSAESLGMKLVYDVAHNIAKMEEHAIDGKKTRICVHRKGATRAFNAGSSDIPPDYKDIGQPVIIPGDMGRNSYVLTGTDLAMEETFGTVCHGAGRMMSRNEAIRTNRGRNITKELAQKGITVLSAEPNTLLEEIPSAYKDVNDVVNVVHNSGLAMKVAKMRPVGVVKG